MQRHVPVAEIGIHPARTAKAEGRIGQAVGVEAQQVELRAGPQWVKVGHGAQHVQVAAGPGQRHAGAVGVAVFDDLVARVGPAVDQRRVGVHLRPEAPLQRHLQRIDADQVGVQLVIALPEGRDGVPGDEARKAIGVARGVRNAGAAPGDAPIHPPVRIEEGQVDVKARGLRVGVEDVLPALGVVLPQQEVAGGGVARHEDVLDDSRRPNTGEFKGVADVAALLVGQHGEDGARRPHPAVRPGDEELVARLFPGEVRGLHGMILLKEGDRRVAQRGPGVADKAQLHLVRVALLAQPEHGIARAVVQHAGVGGGFRGVAQLDGAGLDHRARVGGEALHEEPVAAGLVPDDGHLVPMHAQAGPPLALAARANHDRDDAVGAKAGHRLERGVKAAQPQLVVAAAVQQIGLAGAGGELRGRASAHVRSQLHDSPLARQAAVIAGPHDLVLAVRMAHGGEHGPIRCLGNRGAVHRLADLLQQQRAAQLAVDLAVELAHQQRRAGHVRRRHACAGGDIVEVGRGPAGALGVALGKRQHGVGRGDDRPGGDDVGAGCHQVRLDAAPGERGRAHRGGRDDPPAVAEQGHVVGVV